MREGSGALSTPSYPRNAAFESQLQFLQSQWPSTHLRETVLHCTKGVPFRHPLLKLSRAGHSLAGPFFLRRVCRTRLLAVVTPNNDNKKRSEEWSQPVRPAPVRLQCGGSSSTRALSPTFLQFGPRVRRSHIDREARLVLVTTACGYSTMVVQQPSKLNTRVRFPLPAPPPCVEGLLQSPWAARQRAASGTR
jgi:hypothetical protein